MNTGLDFLARLSSEDVDWLLTHGVERGVLSVHERVVVHGEPIEGVFIVFEGRLHAFQGTTRSSDVLLVLGPGEIIGELTLIDAQPASATVEAVDPSTVLEIPLATLRQRMESNLEFAARLLEALAGTMAQRMRELQNRAGHHLSLPGGAGDEGRALWDDIRGRLEPLKALTLEADQKALEQAGEVPLEIITRLKAWFFDFEEHLDETIGEYSDANHLVAEWVGARLQREFLPYVLLSTNAERWYSRPRGYGGDYMTTELIYRNKPAGLGRIGPVLDRCFLDLSAIRAIRNRRKVMGRLIADVLKAHPSRTAHVTALVAGPAGELFDVYAAMDDPGRLKSTIIDIDLQALDFVMGKRNQRNLANYMTLHDENLVYLATGRRNSLLANQDLIYSVGLIDYFRDNFVVQLLNFIFDSLAPGGKVVLGCMRRRNPSKVFLDHALDWRLIHRTEMDVNRLFRLSRFGREAGWFFYDDLEVGLFGECVKY